MEEEGKNVNHVFVQVFDSNSGSLLHKLDCSSAVRSVAVSPDGSKIVSGCGDGHIRVRKACFGCGMDQNASLHDKLLRFGTSSPQRWFKFVRDMRMV